MSLKPGISKNRFTVEEDCKLMAAFKEFGSNFHLYQSILPGRSTLQIRNRYKNVLSYVGKRSNWTPADDAILMEHVAKFGTSNWAALAAILKHHTRIGCRSRYTAITKHLKNNPNCDLESVPRRRSKLSSEVTSDNWVEKIIEAKKASTNPRRVLSVSLSNYDRQSYNYFKYSYRYDFASGVPPLIPTTDITVNVCRALHCHMCPIDNMLLNALPTATIDLKCLEESKPSAEQTLPPVWDTALLLRGISIMFPYDLSETFREEVRTTELHPALDLFRRRFATLLTNTMIRSKVKQHIKVTIEMDTRPNDLPKIRHVYGGKKRKNTNLSDSPNKAKKM